MGHTATAVVLPGSLIYRLYKHSFSFVYSQARGSVALGDGLSLRGGARLGTTGIDLELGFAKRFTPQITGYLGAMVGYPAGEGAI